jgi:glyoxylase-like metal-dependent hydrolase (beta-lactamase superfamily II)
MTPHQGRSARAAVTADIHRISRLGLVNEYLVAEDDGLTLIDTGLPGTHRLILARAARLGMPIRRIALTHAHRDHTGSLAALAAALPGVQLNVCEREAGLPGDVASAARFVADGDSVGSLRAVATHGHTEGHLAFLDPRDGTLYAGDAFTATRGVATSAVVPWHYPMAGLATWNRELALDSARRLRDLDPDRLATGHGPVVGAPRQAMDRAIAAAARRLGR